MLTVKVWPTPRKDLKLRGHHIQVHIHHRTKMHFSRTNASPWDHHLSDMAASFLLDELYKTWTCLETIRSST